MPWNKINLLIKFKNLSEANIDIWGLSVKTLYMYVTEFAFWLECLTGESGNHSQITIWISPFPVLSSTMSIGSCMILM